MAQGLKRGTVNARVYGFDSMEYLNFYFVALILRQSAALSSASLLIAAMPLEFGVK